MSLDRNVLIRHIDDATQRLLNTVDGLSNDDVSKDSLLPGWTRGHVLTHIARSGDALGNLFIWARNDVEVPAYASQQSRDEDIEAGADREAAELVTDIRSSAERFAAGAASMPDKAWQFKVSVLDAEPFPAEQALVRRLVEVELHHTDLNCGYSAADWPRTFADMELDEPMLSQRAQRKPAKKK